MTHGRTIEWTDEELLAAWRHGNDNGNGWGIGLPGMTPMEAAEDYGLIEIETISGDGCVVGCDGDGTAVVVCDSNGPWAVTVD